MVWCGLIAALNACKTIHCIGLISWWVHVFHVLSSHPTSNVIFEHALCISLWTMCMVHIVKGTHFSFWNTWQHVSYLNIDNNNNNNSISVGMPVCYSDCGWFRGCWLLHCRSPVILCAHGVFSANQSVPYLLMLLQMFTFYFNFILYYTQLNRSTQHMATPI